jgi:hypothetical protein
MTYQNDREAFCLANTYGLLPPHAVYPSRIRNTNTGKYEPDHTPEAESRCMVLAHYSGRSNIIVQYNPDLNFVIAYHVTGTLTPDAVDNYIEDGENNEKPSYSNPLKEFIILWDGIDSWIINEQWAGPDNPGWKRTDPSIEGDYTPYAGATGIATVVIGPE